jgi:hypothetical protein
MIGLVVTIYTTPSTGQRWLLTRDIFQEFLEMPSTRVSSSAGNPAGKYSRISGMPEIQRWDLEREQFQEGLESLLTFLPFFFESGLTTLLTQACVLWTS